MRVWFTVKVKFAKETEEGLLKQVLEQYLVDGVSFTEVESIIYDKVAERVRGDFQVTHIAKSNIVDVFQHEDGDIWFKAKIQCIVMDSGKEKKVTQYMLVTAADVPQAHERIQENLSNMPVSFQVPDVVETKIIEVFPYESEEESF